MAPSSSLLLMATVALLILPATLSQICKMQTFSQNNITFANCTDLPTLKSTLHWNYDMAAEPRPTLSVAFTAPPAMPDGWVSWSLNPTSTGMIGTQAFIAFKDANGSMIVKTYNISSYGPVSESKIAYEVLSKSAEASNGTMTIFATIALPAASAELNQVWMVGSTVVNGVPAKHALAPENLNSKNKLLLVGSANNESAQAPSPAPGGSHNGKDKNGCFTVYGVSLLLAVSIFGF